MKFDVIVGNPPFKGDKTSYNSTNTMSGSVKHLWKKFVSISHNICVDNGYIGLIHPGIWRRPDDGMKNYFWDNNDLIYLNMNSFEEGKKIFGISQGFDWYILKKAPYNGKTKIIDYDGVQYEENINKWKFIPNKYLNQIKSAMSSVPTGYIYESSKFHATKGIDIKNDEYKYPAFYMFTKTKGCVLKYFKNSKKELFTINQK